MHADVTFASPSAAGITVTLHRTRSILLRWMWRILYWEQGRLTSPFVVDSVPLNPSYAVLGPYPSDTSSHFSIFQISSGHASIHTSHFSTHLSLVQTVCSVEVSISPKLMLLLLLQYLWIRANLKWGCFDPSSRSVHCRNIIINVSTIQIRPHAVYGKMELSMTRSLTFDLGGANCLEHVSVLLRNWSTRRGYANCEIVRLFDQQETPTRY